MKWTDEREAFLRANAAQMTDEEIAAYIVRVWGEIATRRSIQKKRRRLGLSKKMGKGQTGLKVTRFEKSIPGFGLHVHGCMDV